MQPYLVLLIVMAAAAYLGFRAYKLWFGTQQKGCEKCAVQKKPSAKQTQ
jgi:hypothetical protein